MSATNSGMANTWVFGKVEPGWYVAYNGWNEAYGKHLEGMGYRVVRSVTKSEVA